METREYQVYKYDELTEAQQEKVMEHLWDINVNHEWWDFVYMDAETVGLKIDSFDDRHLEGDLIMSVGESCRAILDNHGPTCDTYKLALEYYRRKHAKGPDAWPGTHFDVEEFFCALREEYRVILNETYEYLTSRKETEETIRSNDYDFTEDGKID